MNLLYVGIGLKKGVHENLIQIGINQVFQKHNFKYDQIAAIATLDCKASELGLLSFCESHNLSLITFSAEDLKTVIVPHPQLIVNDLVGTPSVAESSAILAASQMGNIKLMNVNLVVPKQMFRLPETKEMITLAVAGESLGDFSK